MRIGDQERERAAAALAEHFASGRLSHSEYAERFDAVWTARTTGDLKTLFHDLPATGRGATTAHPVRASRRQRHGFRLPGVLWVVLAVLLVVLAVKTAIALLFAFVPLLLLVLVGVIAFRIGRGRRRRQRRAEWYDRL